MYVRRCAHVRTRACAHARTRRGLGAEVPIHMSIHPYMFVWHSATSYHECASCIVGRFDGMPISAKSSILLGAGRPSHLSAYRPSYLPACVDACVSRYDVFGERGILLKQPRSASVVANGICEVATNLHSCLHTHTYAHVLHTHAYAHVCVHTYTHVCAHTYAHVCTHAYAHVRAHTRLHTCLRICLRTCCSNVYAGIQAHVCTHMFAHVSSHAGWSN